ncbi:MAG: chorismate mutase, partial [Planctomycetota bacterium]
MAKRASKKTAKRAPKKVAKRATRKTTGRAAKKATRKATKKATRGRAAGRPDRAGSPEASESPKQTAELAALRKKIDRVDQKLVATLNERADLVVQVGKVKRGSGTPIYAPHREAQVLDRAIANNHGPLPNRTIEGIYRELMSGSFALEQPLRIGYLGPPGSQSHVAAMKQFGRSVDYEDLREIGGVFTEVRRGHVNYGLVPIENSTGGGIAETLDAFQKHTSRVSIYAEAQLAVHHALLAICKPGEITRVYSKPEVFSQCRTWLATQLPRAEQIAAASSSRAAQIAAEECATAERIGHKPTTAAIGTSRRPEM